MCANDFRFYTLRFTLRAEELIEFPHYLAGNVVRGALGSVADKRSIWYGPLFQPGPHIPRAFVPRVRHLDGHQIAAGQSFEIALNVFVDQAADYLAETVRRLEHTGLGTPRRAVRLLGVDGVEPPLVNLHCEQSPECSRIRLHFLTPTSIKGAEHETGPPRFAALFSQLRNRLSRLREAYGEGALPRDWKGQARAGAVNLIASDLHDVTPTRYSSKTRQTHNLAGFVGTADYEGILAEFLPLLALGRVAGVGRYTNWGNGELSLEQISEPPEVQR